MPQAMSKTFNHILFEELMPITQKGEDGMAGGTADRSPETKREESANIGGIKKACLSFAASLQEGIAYIKAFFVGQGKKLTAKNEREASEADLQASKIQVEATDAAEDTKQELDKTRT